MTPADVTIVVLNWNRRQETIACIESLERADLQGAKVMVVDNGSRDGSVEALRARFPSLRVVALPENQGFAGGNNVGMRIALDEGAGGVLLLNNDTEVAPDFLPPLVQALNDSPISGAVSSAIFRMDRRDMLDVAYCEVHLNQRHAVQLQGVNALPGLGYDKRREVQVVPGCSVLFKSEALRTVGLFDEAYFAYHEDVDWCLRARDAGYQLFFEPFSRVFHLGSGTTGALRRRPDGVVKAIDPTDPNAEPLPWNPVRTYLGIRNTVRLVRAYANRGQKAAFARACIRELPLEFSALLMNEAGLMRLGLWSYERFAREYFVDRHPILRERPDGTLATLRRGLGFVVLPLADALWCLPRDVVRAWRRGRFIEFREYLRGLRDGVLGRRLPLRRLGLR